MAIKFRTEPLKTTTAFHDLVCTVTFNSRCWADLQRNLWKAQWLWGVAAKVISKTGVPLKSQAMIHKAVVQVVILYGSEIWVVTDAIMVVLEGFRHSIAIQILGMMAQMGAGREW